VIPGIVAAAGGSSGPAPGALVFTGISPGFRNSTSGNGTRSWKFRAFVSGGTAPLTYQWTIQSMSTSGSISTTLINATTDRVTVQVTGTDAYGEYQLTCTVTDAALAQVSGQAYLTVGFGSFIIP
jgi:hypothetical protein